MKRNKRTPSASRAVHDETLGVSWGWHSVPVPFYRPTWVEISTQNFTHNLRSVRSCIRSGTGILAVVKANAYGHMAVPLARIAEEQGVAAMGVSSIEEGVSLREGGVTAKILILGSIYPLENLASAVEHGLIPTVSSTQGLAHLVHLASRFGRRLPFHLKIDTGMGRVGITPESARQMIDRIASRSEVVLEGMYMHFCAAGSDPAFTKRQFERFVPVVAYARKRGLKFVAHAANSSALMRHPRMQLDWVRPGIVLYGLVPCAGTGIDLRPVMSWKTRVVFIKKVPSGTSVSYDRAFITRRPSLIATLPVGYADGFPRALSNRGAVLIGGRRCPVVGRVTMDMIMADVTDVPGADVHDEAVLIGSQGGETITAEELAGLLGTITYEVTCGISYRVPRIMV